MNNVDVQDNLFVYMVVLWANGYNLKLFIYYYIKITYLLFWTNIQNFTIKYNSVIFRKSGIKKDAEFNYVY